MTLLSECVPSRWIDFLSISDDNAYTDEGSDQDLFVGRRRRVTLFLDNGTTTRFRDVVVLGELNVMPSYKNNSAVKPQLVVRDFFAPGKVRMTDCSLSHRKLVQHKNAESFRKELQVLFLDWLQIQRDSVEKIGLRSVLV